MTKRVQKEGETVEEYAYEMMRLFKKCGNLSDIEKKNYFMEGLKTDIGMYVMLSKAKTFEEALQDAKTKEKVMKKEQNSKNEEQ